MKPLHLILMAALLLTLCGCAQKEDVPAVTPSSTPEVTAAPVERPLQTAEPTVTPESTPTAEPTPSPAPTVTPEGGAPDVNLKDNQTPFG